MKRREYSHRLEFEHELINRRVTWLLTSQGLLFAAYGVALDKSSQLLSIIRVVGIAVAGCVLIGVLASLFAKYHTWQDFKSDPVNSKEEFWVRTWITYMGFVPDVTIPLVFIAAWLYLSRIGPCTAATTGHV